MSDYLLILYHTKLSIFFLQKDDFAAEETIESINVSQSSQESQYPENMGEENNEHEQGQEIIEPVRSNPSTSSTVSTVTSKKREREDPRLNEAFTIMKNIEARKASKTEKNNLLYMESMLLAS